MPTRPGARVTAARIPRAPPLPAPSLARHPILVPLLPLLLHHVRGTLPRPLQRAGQLLHHAVFPDHRPAVPRKLTPGPI